VLGYLIARIASACLLFVAVTIFTFVLFFVLPRPQIDLPGRGGEDDVDLRESLRLEGSVPSQYVQFFKRFVTDGSLGSSYYNRRPVNDILKQTVPVTLSLVAGGVIFWLLIAFPVGIISALRPRSLIDRAGMVFVLIGISAHPAWVSLMLSYFMGFRLEAFPINGYCDLISPSEGARCGGPTQWIYHLILPWFALALLFAALYARMIRAAVLETLEEDYVRTARAKGASSFRVLRGHVFRNALLPVVTMVGMDAGMFLTGTIFIESVFGLPGVGGLLRSSINSRDLPIVLGIVMFTTTVILVLNLVIDLVYPLLDPRVRVREDLHRRRAARPTRQGVPQARTASVG
jgi:peptide/nickel transport system permease protein